MNFNEKYLQQLIGFLPQNIIEKIIEYPSRKLVNNETTYEVCILFSDISGFTSMSEAFAGKGIEGIEEMSRILNDYFENIEEVIRKHEGYIQKTAGDSATIIFIKNKDESMKDVICKGVRCSLEIQNLINKRYQQIETIAGIYKLKMKIGISSGYVYSDCVGESNFGLKHILYGQPIIDSAKGESIAESGEIRIDGKTKNIVDAELTADEEKDGFFRVLNIDDKNIKYNYIKPVEANKIAKENQILLIEKIKSFIPEEIYNRIILGQRNFISEHRKITVMFIQFKGILNDVNEGIGKIRGYIVIMNRIIEKYGGRLQEYEGGDKGDKLLAVFGTPKSFENNEERAVLCANEIIREGRKLDYISEQSIGIASGNVYAGIVGFGLYKSYTTIGDIVNVASRLMQYASKNHYGIITEKNVYDRLSNVFDFESMTPINVKNRKQPISIYRIEEKEKTTYKSYFDRRIKSSVPIVGRKEELDDFERLIKEVDNKNGQIISITGEAGIGKSKLADEFIKTLLNKGYKGYGGECLSYGTNIPYISWNQILYDLFEIDDNQSNEESLKQIELLLTEVNPNFKNKTPIIGDILGYSVEENDLTKNLDAKLRKENLFSIILETIKYKSRDENLFLLIEDAHWIDSISLELLNYICRNISDNSIMIIIVFRPLGDFVNRNYREIFDYKNHSMIELKYLQAEEISEMLKLRLKNIDIPEDFKNTMVVRSQGNPFFIEEIINSLEDNNYISYNEAETKYNIIKDLSTITIPNSINDVVLSRIDKLDESSKLTLKIASVIGRQFRFNVLKSVYPRENKPENEVHLLINNNLNKLGKMDLTKLDIEEPELEYIFKHAITQEVSYSSLLFSFRRELHEKIASYYEKHQPDKVDLIAHHYENSDNTDKKIEFYQKAVASAEKNYANQEAIKYYKKLLNILEKEIDKSRTYLLNDYHKKINELWEKENTTEIEKYIDRSESLLKDINNENIKTVFKSEKAKLLFEKELYSKALDGFKEALESNKKIENKERVIIDCYNIGVTYFYMNEYENSRKYLENALSIAEDVKDKQLINTIKEALEEL